MNSWITPSFVAMLFSSAVFIFAILFLIDYLTNLNPSEPVVKKCKYILYSG